ncbi:MAG: putative arsenate reductase [Sphingomonas bacterium]|nr:putative arsenate reductase [Sphingomonas bacterium]
MKATIWHNPRCSKSRETLAILREAPGVDVTVIEYLKQPPSLSELSRLIGLAGLKPKDAVRKSETGSAALADAGQDDTLAAMAADPALIERPLVETDKGVRLCRPPERVREIL